MKQLFFVIVAFIAFIAVILPQTSNIIFPQIIESKIFSFGGNRDEMSSVLGQNGYYYIAGTNRITGINPPNKSYASLIKLSSSGEPIWELKGPDSTFSMSPCISPAPDGIYWSVSNSRFMNSSFIYKIDNNDNIVWQKFFDQRSGILITSDNNYLVVVQGDFGQSRIVFFNSQGDSLFFWNTPLKSIYSLILKDNYLYIAGDAPPGGTWLNYNVEIYKYDLDGNVIWHDILQDGVRPSIVIDDNYLYLTRWFYMGYDSTGWETVKYNTDNGIRIWERHWNGDWFGTSNVGGNPKFIIRHPEGGCIVVGSLTKVGHSDPNSTDAAAISYDEDGSVRFKFRYDYQLNWYVTNFVSALFDGDQLVAFGTSLESYGVNYTRQLFYTKWNNVTSVTPEPGVLPTAYLLYQNYPNPFNPITTIKFSTPHSGNVLLKVFNLLGQEIETLVDEYLPAGNYSVQFTGQNLPSGIYIYELRTENFSTAKKMTVIK